MATPSTSTDSTSPVPESITLVIPAFNEEQRLARSLPVARSYLQAQCRDWELLVVDDGSTDRTAAIAAAAGAHVLRLERNQGKGAAVRAGMLAATGQIILFTDADLSTPVTEIARALECHEQGADVVIGSRALPTSDVQVHQNLVRERLGKAFNVLVRLLSGLPYKDTQCGFKSFRRAAAQAVFGGCQTDGFAFDVEALILARQRGYRIEELPVSWVNSPQSKVQIWRHPWQMLLELVRIRWRARGGRAG